MRKRDAGDKHAEVFISATSGDLRSVREIVKHGLLTLGCFPIEQANFPPDYRGVYQMLEERIARCDAVIHIVGRRYGEEPDPASLPAGTPRRSYTQWEAEIARQLGKKLYIFLCPEDFPYDEEPDVESVEIRALQQAYRRQVAQGQSLHTAVHTRDDIALRVRELQFELEKLKGTVSAVKGRTFAVMAAILLALVALAAGVWWNAHENARTARAVEEKYSYDPAVMRERWAAFIKHNAEAQIAGLDPVKDWRQIQAIQKWEAQKLATMDDALAPIKGTLEGGKASDDYQTAAELLQDKGGDEALDFLNSKADDRKAAIEQLEKSAAADKEELHKKLREELLAASILETKFRFDDAEAAYRRVFNEDTGWADGRDALAVFLTGRGALVDPAKGNGMLREAINICQGTIALSPKDNSPQDWAITQVNLGIAFANIGDRGSGEESKSDLTAAVGAYTDALEVFTKADFPQDWARTEMNLGNAFVQLGERSSGEESESRLAAAVEAYNHALEVYNKADFPQNWAKTEMNLGVAFDDLGERSSGDESKSHLTAAVEAYNRSLEIYTKADVPQDWARTEMNLGNAFWDLGECIGGAEGNRELAAAVDAYDHALEVHTKADFPQDWARTQMNLGNAYWGLGKHTSGEESKSHLTAAVDAYNRALEVYTKADLPRAWAIAQMNLGNAFVDLGKCSSGEESKSHLRAAVDACNRALEVYTKADLPRDWALTQMNLANAFVELGKRSSGQESKGYLTAAVDSCKHALEVYTKADLPLEWAITQLNLGDSFENLGKRTGGEESKSDLTTAVEAYNHALEVFSKTFYPDYMAEAATSRDGALAELSKAKSGQGGPSPGGSP